MQPMSIKDYAASRGVSYEAVRQRVKRYADELTGHIIQQGRTQYLDEQAMELLDEHQAAAPLVITSDNDQIKQLQAELAAAKDRLIGLQDALMSAKDALIASAGQQALLDAANRDREQLQAQIAATAAETAQREAVLQAEIRDLASAKAALEARNAALEANLEAERKKNKPFWAKWLAK